MEKEQVSTPKPPQTGEAAEEIKVAAKGLGDKCAYCHDAIGVNDPLRRVEYLGGKVDVHTNCYDEQGKKAAPGEGRLIFLKARFVFFFHQTPEPIPPRSGGFGKRWGVGSSFKIQKGMTASWPS